MPPKLNLTDEEKRLRRNEQSRLAKAKKVAEAKAAIPVAVAEEGDLEAFAPKKRGGARIKQATAGLSEAEKKARRNEQSRLSKQKRKTEKSDAKFAEEYRTLLPSAKAMYEEQQAKAKAKAEAPKKVPLTEKLKRQQEIIAKYPPLPKVDLSTLSEAEKKARRNEQSRMSKAKAAELKALEELKDYDFEGLLDMDTPSPQAPATPMEVRQERKKEKARVAKATQRAKAKAEAPKMKEARVATPPPSNVVQDTLQSITKRIAEIKATPAQNSRHSEFQAEAIERELEKLDALMRPAQAEQSSSRIMPFKPQSLQPALKAPNTKIAKKSAPFREDDWEVVRQVSPRAKKAEENIQMFIEEEPSYYAPSPPKSSLIRTVLDLPKPKYVIGRKGDELLEEGEITPRGKNLWDGSKRIPLDKPQTPRAVEEEYEVVGQRPKKSPPAPPKVIEVIREVSRPPMTAQQFYDEKARKSRPVVSAPVLSERSIARPVVSAPVLSERSIARMNRVRQIFNSEASREKDIRRALTSLPAEESDLLKDEFKIALRAVRKRDDEYYDELEMNREERRTRKPLTQAEIEWAMSDDLEKEEDVKEIKKSIEVRPNNEVSSAKVMPQSPAYSPSEHYLLYSPSGRRRSPEYSPPPSTPSIAKPPTPQVEQKLEKMSSAPLSDFDFDTISLTTAREDLETATDFPSGYAIISKVESEFKPVIQKYTREICYSVNRNTDLLKAYWDALDKAKSRVGADHLRQLREDRIRKREMATPEGYERTMFGDFEKLDTPSPKPSPDSPKMTQEEIEAMFAEYDDPSEEEEEDSDDEDYFEKYAFSKVSGWKSDFTEDEIKLIEASAERAITPTRVKFRRSEELPLQTEVDEAISKKYGLPKNWVKKAQKLMEGLRDKYGISDGFNWMDVAKRIIEGKIEIEGKGVGRKLKILELFKGTGSVGKAARRRGMDVRSLDFLEKYKPDILADMLTWDYKKWSAETNWVPDLIWASPPCNTFSPLAYPLKERNTKTATPYSARAKQGTQILYRTLEAIKFFKSKNPNLLFVIENPRGMMRMDAKMKKLPMETTTYCAYGDFKRKPTDFWNNLPNGLTLKPLGPCPNPEKVVRVDKLKTIEERYSIPQRLMTKLLTEMATQYGEKPRNVIGGYLMSAKKGGYWDFDEDGYSEYDKEDFIKGNGLKKKVADMTPAEREKQNAYSREYKRLKRDLAKTTLIPKQNKTAVLNELMAKYPAYAEHLATKRNKAPCGEGCFSEAEVQELLKEMAEWVKAEVIEPSKAEVLKEAKADIKALKDKNKKKRVYASEVPVKTKKQVERYNQLYAQERAEHQASLKENYPTASGRGLKKGSAEAKAWGEKMRAMRGKGKSAKVIESKKPCCKMCSGSGCYLCG